MPPIDPRAQHAATIAHNEAANAGGDPTTCLDAALEAYHAHLAATGQLAPARAT